MRLRKQAPVALLAIGSGLSLSQGQAAIVGGTPGVITEYSVYPQYGGGDVIFRSAGSVAGCHGYWLRPDDLGFKEAFATLLTAYVTQSPLVVWVLDDSIWDGSASAYCRVYRLNAI
jgi:hypothetical protein